MTAALPLLLLHGAGLCGGVFDPLVEALGDDVRCLTPDLRGHGRRAVPARRGDHGLGEQAPDVISLLDQHDIERVAVLGHSYGGAVALRAALDHPDRFGPMLLHEPAIGNLLDPPAEARARGRAYEAAVARRRSTWPSAQAMFDDLRRWRPYGEFSDAFLMAFVRSGSRPTERGGVELACDPRTEGLLFTLTLSPAGGNGLHERLAEIAARPRLTITVGTMHAGRLGLFEALGRRIGVPPVRFPGAHFALFHSVDATLELIAEHLGIGGTT